MDALITTILAGAAVAVIGAFAAYYFGGRREAQKQVYEERRDEEKQREARQDELRKHSAEALAQIQAQASVVVEDVKSWGADATVLREIVDACIESAGGRIKRLALSVVFIPLNTSEEGVR
jgi:H+/gluconate symporter-like permease